MDKQFILKYSKLLVVFLFIYNPGFSQKGEKPHWLDSRPASSLYYTGIGVSSKAEEDYQSKAKQNALADLASEISITISGSSLLQKFENDEQVIENFKKETLVSFINELEGYELAGTYEDDDHYWVYYRLLRQTYQEMKQKKLDNAKAISFDFYNKALAAKKDYHIHNAIDFGIKAINALHDYLNDNITVTIDGSEKNLASEIYSLLTEMLQHIKIRAKADEMVLSAFSDKENCIGLSTVYIENLQFIPIGEIPLLASLDDNTSVKAFSTDHKGVSMFCLFYKPVYKMHNRIFIKLDIDNYTRSSFIRQMLVSASMPEKTIRLKTTDIKAYLVVNSTEYGRRNPNSTFANLIKNDLSQTFRITKNKNEADVVIQINSKLYDGGKVEGDMYDMEEVFMDASVSVTHTKNNQVILNESISSLRLLVNEKDSPERRIKAMNDFAVQKINELVKPALLNMKL